ncbi:MAG: hypothetical protein R8N24_00700 [Alphaproteobacteria bacterium]|nr:hypothetical protein [Alphaproteobacteria bacterium]
MKKLTAGILASLIGLVSANSAEAAVASTKYVDEGLATKQQKLTELNFKKDGQGKFVTGVTFDQNGDITFTSADQAEAVYDSTWNPESTNAVQAKVIADKIAAMASNTTEANKVVKSVTQEQGKITPVYGQVTGADIAAETIESANIKNGTIATDDIANSAVTSDKIADNAVTSAKIVSVTMDQVTDLGTTLAGKQATLTNAANAGEGIKISEDGKIAADVTTAVLSDELAKKQNTFIWGTNLTYDATTNTVSATDTTYSTGTEAAEGLTKLYTTTGDKTDGTMTQKAITDELGTKQAKLTDAANAGTGITIDDATGKISADNQLDGVTDSGSDGLQVLTRKNCVSGVCEYVWEDIDRTFGN